jgi:uncharacterized membrane protein YfcA
MWEYSLVGLLVGFAVGATGVGGGSLMTPTLIFGFGLPTATAVGTDLLYAAVTQAFGVLFHGRQKTVEFPVVGWLALGSVPATIATITVLNIVGVGPVAQQVMTYALGVAIIVTALLTLLRRKIKRLGARRIDPSVIRTLRQRWRKPATVLAGFFLGAVVTLTSVGAGSMGTMILLLLYPGLAAVSVVGTDLTHAVLLTALAGLGHLTLGTSNLAVLAFLLMGSLPGIYLGTRFGLRLPDGLLRVALVGVLLVAGFGLIV